MPRFLLALAITALTFGSVDVRAADIHEATLTIRDHRFVPAELKVPAGRKIKLTVVNTDPTAEEFESYELNREKVVAGNGRIVVFVGPLRPGRYPFFGEFHMDTAKGALIAE
ncbi:MAG: cupredoxin domain-containing protein [Thermomonas sp.]